MPDPFPTPTLDDDLALIRHALRTMSDPRNPMGVAPAVNALDRVAIALGRDVSDTWPRVWPEDDI